jgi:hypothetical protein
MNPETAPDTRRSFQRSRSIFVKLLGVIHLVAFASLWSQLDGLLGSNGILPAQKYLDAVKESVPDSSRFLEYPTIFWWSASDTALGVACAFGVAAALLILAGIGTRLALVVEFVLYLSLSTVARVFLAYQWDILLLEVTITAIFLAGPSPGIGAFGINRLLFFKLVFSSGIAKLMSGDETWRNLSALEYHYETQPLPTPLAWWAHQLPPGFHEVSTLATFFIQLVVPFCLFLPRPLRLAAVVLSAFHQLLIALTGNYCFFNLIALALLLLFVDDAVWKKILRREAPLLRETRTPAWLDGARAVGLALLVVANGFVFARTLRVAGDRPDLLELIAPFRAVNGYGLFAVMTTERKEIIIEGSDDGVEWKPYTLPHQPGDLTRRPEFVAPHQPRVDWQMWFAALGTVRQNGWFQALLWRLFEGSKEVSALFETNPFPGVPPKYLRAELYLYRFTSGDEREATGAFWKREYLGPYVPVVQNNVRESTP